jgi:hypothetical protein
MFDVIVADNDLEALRSFEPSGWGRISGRLYLAVAAQDDDDYGGSENDPAKIADLLRLQGIDLHGVPIEKLGGIGWG